MYCATILIYFINIAAFIQNIMQDLLYLMGSAAERYNQLSLKM
jgi:hypothetical protein